MSFFKAVTFLFLALIISCTTKKTGESKPEEPKPVATEEIEDEQADTSVDDGEEIKPEDDEITVVVSTLQQPGPNGEAPEYPVFVATEKDLPKCLNEIEGLQIAVYEESAVFVCKDGKFVKKKDDDGEKEDDEDY